MTVVLSRREKATLAEFIGQLEQRVETLPPKPAAIWLAELREQCLAPDPRAMSSSLWRGRHAWQVFHEATMRGAERDWPHSVQVKLECIRECALTTAMRAYGQAAQDTATNDTVSSLWRQVDELTRSPA